MGIELRHTTWCAHSMGVAKKLNVIYFNLKVLFDAHTSSCPKHFKPLKHHHGK